MASVYNNKEVNIRTVLTMEPEEIFENMHRMYDDIEVPEIINGPEDLTFISKTLGWCTNNKSYLSSLGVYLDIATRALKKSGDKDAYSTMVCRKNIINSYYEHIDAIYKACSRQASIYFEQVQELKEEKRNNAVQHGGGGDWK